MFSFPPHPLETSGDTLPAPIRRLSFQSCFPQPQSRPTSGSREASGPNDTSSTAKAAGKKEDSLCLGVLPVRPLRNIHSRRGMPGLPKHALRLLPNHEDPYAITGYLGGRREWAGGKGSRRSMASARGYGQRCRYPISVLEYSLNERSSPSGGNSATDRGCSHDKGFIRWIVAVGGAWASRLSILGAERTPGDIMGSFRVICHSSVRVPRCQCWHGVTKALYPLVCSLFSFRCVEASSASFCSSFYVLYRPSTFSTSST
ncbi:hypothetical protein BKA61DRAFT_623343, partial [Leptodontidium sp. MPI-SDFR-AT-0119]